MSHLHGSRTEKNLLAAFAGESQARNRYTYYASQARKDGFVQISDIFLETAEQEKEHAKRFFKFLQGGEVEIRDTFPAGVITSTATNLEHAAAGERAEWEEVYPRCAQDASEEGFSAIASVFAAVAVAERQHEKRYRGVLANIEAGTVFKSVEPTIWRCRNCGYVHEGIEAVNVCPACAHPQAHFERLAENW